MNLNSAIAVGSSSLLRAILFTRDPALPSTIDTPNGALTMLQVVGVTLDEVLAVKQWDSQKFLILFEQHITGALTDLERDSLFSNPAFATCVQMAISTDGSSTGTLFPAAASFRGDSSGATRRVIVKLGANGVRELLQVFPGRLPFDRPLTIVCRDRAICFTPSRTAGWESTPGEPTLQIHSTHQFASELLAVLKAEAGEYHFESMPNLSMVVERSAISDRDGIIVEWIG